MTGFYVRLRAFATAFAPSLVLAACCLVSSLLGSEAVFDRVFPLRLGVGDYAVTVNGDYVQITSLCIFHAGFALFAVFAASAAVTDPMAVVRRISLQVLAVSMACQLIGFVPALVLIAAMIPLAGGITLYLNAVEYGAKPLTLAMLVTGSSALLVTNAMVMVQTRDYLMLMAWFSFAIVWLTRGYVIAPLARARLAELTRADAATGAT